MTIMECAGCTLIAYGVPFSIFLFFFLWICTDDDLADDIEFIEDLNIGETSRRYIIVPPQMPIFQPNQAPPIQSGQVHQHNETPSVQSGQALEQNQAPPMQPDQVHQHNRSQQFPELHLSHIGAAIAGVFLGMIIMKILK